MARNLRVGVQRGLRQSIGGGLGTGDIFTLSQASFDFSRTNTIDSRITFSRASSGTFVGADGLIKTTPSDAPRFDHSATGESLGLLIEEARTNFALNSDSVQGSSIGTPIPNSTASVVSPRGITETVRQLGRDVSAGGAQTWRVGSASGGTANTTYTISFYAKTVSGGTTSINVDINDITPTGGQATTITGEWTRITKTGGSANNNLRFFDMNMVTATADFYVWGAQIEVGSFATSYIPTTSSQVTRAADVAEITGTNFSSFFNPEASTVFVDGNITAGPTGQYVLFAIKKSTSNPAFNMSRRSAQGSRFNRFNPSGSQDINFNGPTWTDNSFRKLACAMGQTSASFVDSGSLIGTTTTYVKPAASDGLTKLVLGNAERGGFVPYNVHIKRLAYFPTRLSDANLQAITT